MQARGTWRRSLRKWTFWPNCSSSTTLTRKPKAMAGQDHKNGSERGKDDFCWSSNSLGSDKEGAPLAWHQNEVNSSSSSSSSGEEHQSSNETDSTSDSSEDEEAILNWIQRKDKPSRTPVYDGRLKWGTYRRCADDVTFPRRGMDAILVISCSLILNKVWKI